MYSGIDTSVNVKEWVEPAGVDMGVELKDRKCWKTRRKSEVRIREEEGVSSHIYRMRSKSWPVIEDA
jgi:hypothetical protein